MAKILMLCVIFSIVAAEASTQPLSPATKKSIEDLALLFQKVTDSINTATPLAKKPEAALAAMKLVQIAELHIAKAAKEGDDKKVHELILSYRIASGTVINAQPDKRLKVMEETFNSVAAPNLFECPNADKAFCETRSKIEKASLAVSAAASPEQNLWDKDSAFLKTMHTAVSTINKAFANGDEKEIARVFGAYNNAADLVIAAPPNDKLKVMVSTFEHAAAMGA